MRNTNREHKRLAIRALNIIKPEYDEADIQILMLSMNIVYCNGKIEAIDNAQDISKVEKA